MIAYKVEHYGRNSFTPTIDEKEIDKFTKTRVYFKSINRNFENIKVHDFSYPHTWFENRKDAVVFCIETLKQKIINLKSNMEEAKAALSHYRSESDDLYYKLINILSKKYGTSIHYKVWEEEIYPTLLDGHLMLAIKQLKFNTLDAKITLLEAKYTIDKIMKLIEEK